MIGNWVLILWLTCEGSGLTSIEVESYKMCINTAEQWMEKEKSSCKHYQCIQVNDGKKVANVEKHTFKANREKPRKIPG